MTSRWNPVPPCFGYKGRSDGGGRAYVRRSDSGRNGIRKAVYGYRRRSAAAGEDSYIPFVEDGTGAYTYEVPAEVLNQPVDCAAWSIRKEQWYDRKLVFLADSLPQEAVKMTAASAVSVTDASDGIYQLTVNLGEVPEGRRSKVRRRLPSQTDGLPPESSGAVRTTII